MRRFATALVVFSGLIGLSSAAFADEYVNGYVRSDGTYVQGHWRSSPDGNPYNNWSTQGNTNPYTGEQGTQSPNNQNNNPYGSSYGSTSGNSNNPYGSSYGN